MADKALHIGVDARELCGKPTGVGRYLLGVLREWAAAPDFPHRVTLFAPAELPPQAAMPSPRFATVVSPAAAAGTWWEQIRLPGLIRRAGVDVWFAAGYTAPLGLRRPSVAAVYDVSFYAHPEWFSPREGRRRRLITRAAARRAHRVITISEFSASEIVRFLSVSRERIVIAPPGPPSVQRPSLLPQPEPIVLFVGSLFNRRRIDDLIRAFALVASHVPYARLVLVGDNRTSPHVDPIRLAASLGLGDRVEWRAFLPDDELERLYWTARVFAFLSDYEGFALTPMEALAHAVPPVLLETPVAAEVYGEGALLVPPDVEKIGEAIRLLLTDAAVRARVLLAGRARLAALSWERTADAIRHALEDAAAGAEAVR